MNVAGIDRLWTVVQRWQRHGRRESSCVRVSAAELTLRWPQGVQTLVDCDAQIGIGGSGIAWPARHFDLRARDAESPAQLGVRWNTSAEADSTTTLKLETGSAPLPCSLLAALVHRRKLAGAELHVSRLDSARGNVPPGGRSKLTGQIGANRFAIGGERSFSASADRRGECDARARGDSRRTGGGSDRDRFTPGRAWSAVRCCVRRPIR